jgi:syntaxin 18
MVCDIHSQQKAIRIKRAVEKQRLLRLGNMIVNKNTSNDSKKSKINLNSDTYENQAIVSQTFPENNKENEKNYNRTKAIEDLNNETYQQLELSKDELQVFEEENKHLYKEMNSLSDEVKYVLHQIIH